MTVAEMEQKIRELELEYKDFLTLAIQKVEEKDYFWFAEHKNYDKCIKIKRYLQGRGRLSEGLKKLFNTIRICKKRGKLDEYLALSKSLI